MRQARQLPTTKAIDKIPYLSTINYQLSIITKYEIFNSFGEIFGCLARYVCSSGVADVGGGSLDALGA